MYLQHMLGERHIAARLVHVGEAAPRARVRGVQGQRALKQGGGRRGVARRCPLSHAERVRRARVRRREPPRLLEQFPRLGQRAPPRHQDGRRTPQGIDVAPLLLAQDLPVQRQRLGWPVFRFAKMVRALQECAPVVRRAAAPAPCVLWRMIRRRQTMLARIAAAA